MGGAARGGVVRRKDLLMADDWARPVVAWEIQASDAETLKLFYRDLFNWSMTDGPLIRIAAGIAGPLPGPVGVMRTSDRPGVLLYIQVLDLRTTMAKAETMGGKIILEPVDPPGGGPTIAGILDPEGNRLMLVQQ